MSSSDKKQQDAPPPYAVYDQMPTSTSVHIIPHPPQVQQSQPNQRTAGPPYTYTSDHVLGRVKTAIANQMDGYESRTHSCCRSNNSTRISSHTSPKDSVAAVLGEVKTEFKREMQKVKEAKKEVKNEFKKMWTS